LTAWIGTSRRWKMPAARAASARGGGEDLREVLDPPGPAGGDHRDGHRLAHRLDQLQVESEPGAVPVDAVEQDLTSP
jgi:hypothetical protein